MKLDETPQKCSIHVMGLMYLNCLNVALTEIFLEHQSLDPGHLPLSLQKFISLDTRQMAEDVAYSSSWSR